MDRNGVAVEVIRAVDHEIATGVDPDMTEHGWEPDEWPVIFEKVMAADILVLRSPIWPASASLLVNASTSAESSPNARRSGGRRRQAVKVIIEGAA
jgi:hypothetical protein